MRTVPVQIVCIRCSNPYRTTVRGGNTRCPECAHPRWVPLDQEWEGPVGELPGAADRAAEFAERPAYALLCGECENRWTSKAKPGTVLRCPSCGHSKRVPANPRPAAGEPARTAAPPRAARPAPPARRPTPAERLPSLTAAERADALDLDEEPADLDALDLDEDQDESTWVTDVRGMIREFHASRTGGRATSPAPRGRPAPYSIPTPPAPSTSDRLANRTARPPAIGPTRNAPGRPSGVPSAVKGVRVLGFALVPGNQRAPGSCPIRTGGRECPNIADAGISWPEIPELNGAMAVCTPHAYEIKQRAMSEADSEKEIPAIHRAR